MSTTTPKPEVPTPVYRFISDPGHGWLEVPLAEVSGLGIAERISGFSYVSPDGRMAYLEEDCDAAVFAKAKWPGLEYMPADSFVDVYEPNTLIRRFERFPDALARMIAEGRAYIERHGLIRGTKS